MAKKKKAKGSGKGKGSAGKKGKGLTGSGMAKTKTKPKPSVDKEKEWQQKEKLKLAQEMGAFEKRLQIKSIEVGKAAEILKEKKAQFDTIVSDLREAACKINQIDSGTYQKTLPFKAPTPKPVTTTDKKPDSKSKLTEKEMKANAKEAEKELKLLHKKYHKELEDVNDLYEAATQHLRNRHKDGKHVTVGSLCLAVLSSRKKHDKLRVTVWLGWLCDKGFLLQDPEEPQNYFPVSPKDWGKTGKDNK